jgi:uncharacterized repeat protein (TIGR01451 family)
VLLSITVNDVAPSALSYATNPLVATKGVPITSDNPSISGGPVTSWSMSPGLPPGLSFSTSSGVVSGTPTAITAQANYTVTATNSGGFTTRALSITVNDVAPSGLSYEPNPAFFTVGTAITTLMPTLAGGGAVTSWSISPGLPSGLSFSPSTGAISGRPTAAAATAGYVVTAANSGGSATATLTLTVSAPQITIGTAGALAANTDHACAVIAGGVQCWGNNGSGQLGNNSSASSGVPVAVSGIGAGAQAVAGGVAHSCAIVNGGVQCWGANAAGELGNDTTTPSAIPVQVTALTGVQAVTANGYHSCAIVNGGAQCWGLNGAGQLGNNSTVSSRLPVAVSGLGSGVQAIAAGQSHTCALVNGGARCWGDNTDGALGNDSATAMSLVPVQVQGLSQGVQAVGAGQDYSCAVVNGVVWCWGENLYGQLGNASTANSSIPVQVQGLSGGVQAIACGNATACAIVNGAAQCWGWNAYGQLGNNNSTQVQSNVPVTVQGLTGGVDAIAAGTQFACAMVNGALKCWGYGGSGDLGNGATSGSSYVPAQVTGITGGIEAISAGDAFQCAIVNGGAQCWGSNYGGELGNNSTVDSSVPVHVSGLTSGVQAISAGANGSACAVVNGGAWCWGDGYDGALGNDSTSNSLVPVQVQGLTSGVQAITTGSTYACAIMNGGAWCWGYSLQGQIGNPSYEYSSCRFRFRD